MEKQVMLWDAFPIYGYERKALISKEKGCVTIPLQLKLPEVFTLDAKAYAKLQELFSGIIDLLGPNRLLHRQDFFLEETYEPHAKGLQGDFLERANERYFENRPFLRGTHYLYISMVPKNYITHSTKRANTFLRKTREFYFLNTLPEEFMDFKALAAFETQVNRVNHLLNESGLVQSRLLDYDDLFAKEGLFPKYFGLSESANSLKDIDFGQNSIKVGSKKAQFFTVENLDQFAKDYVSTHELYGKFTTANNPFPIGNLFSLGFKVSCEHVLNQYIYIPDQEKVIHNLRKKVRSFQRFGSGKKDDGNTIYGEQIRDYLSDILEKHKKSVFYHLNVMGAESHSSDTMENTLLAAFKKLRIHPKKNSLDRKNLFFAGVPGNGIGIASDMFMPIPSDMAASLLYFEGGYKDKVAMDGMRLVDRISGRPLSISVYREPEENNWIFNRGMLVASGSGGGKSYFVNHYITSELRQGGEAVIMEDGNSYDKLTQVFGGVILELRNDQPFTFNPFLLDSHDRILTKERNIALSENKLLFLVTLLQLLIGDKGQSSHPEIVRTVLENLVVGYYSKMWDSNSTDFKFNSFFEHCRAHLKPLLRQKNIGKESFDGDVFLFLLEKYYKGGPRENLLNLKDERISRAVGEKVVYFKLGNLIENKLLFPIVALMVMDVFNKKMHDPAKRTVNKMLTVDEAWKPLDSPELAHYFNSQSRMARKLGGQPIFISQKVDDFIASKVIKDAIVVNSHIKVFLDMRDFAQSFDKIQSIMGLSEKQRQLILSLNKDLPNNRKLREVALCWMDRAKVYGVETSLEEKCIYETNPTESAKIIDLFDNNHKNWELTAKAYAHHSSVKPKNT